MAYAAAFEARRLARTVTATVIPQVSQPSRPEIHNHGPQFHFYGAASPETARVIRSAIPGQTWDAITEEDR